MCKSLCHKYVSGKGYIFTIDSNSVLYSMLVHDNVFCNQKPYMYELLRYIYDFLYFYNTIYIFQVLRQRFSF